MGSFRGKCELAVVKEEQGKTPRPQTFRHVKAQDKEQKLPIIKKGYNKSLEDDINKLFETVNLRASKSLDLSDLRRNASKKPMRVAASHSPGIGFSEPISLKQALRGLCISQAAEMAATKRLSMPSASPRISEAGRITNLYKSVVVEAGESDCSLTEGGKPGIKISLGPKESTSSSSDTAPQLPEETVVKLATQSSCSFPSFDVKPIMKKIDCVSSDSDCPLGDYSGCNVGVSVVEEETASCSSIKLPQHLEESKKKPMNQSYHSSPHFPVAFVVNGAESSLVHDDTAPVSKAGTQLLETTCSVEEHSTVFVLPHCNASGNLTKPEKKNFGSNKVASGPNTDSATSLEVISKAAPKLKRKSKLQTVPSSNAIKNNGEVKSTRSTSRAVKPVIRNKNLVIKKSKKVVVSTYGNSKKSYEVNSGRDHSSGQIICQKCQCSLRDSSNDPLEAIAADVFMDSKNCDGSKPVSIQTSWENIGIPVVKTNIASKFGEKGDVSQSSKSSICDFSSSTTSLSDESNLSGSTCGNRPHMSKDTRWEAISHIRKHGFLGLNHFNLLKKLGSGDIGTVYLSELIGTNCLFAIKVMDNEFLAKRKKMPRAHTEREILRMLDHPFLPTLYAQFTSDNLSCLVMEFCPGGDLHVLRQKQPSRYFTEQAARFYVAEVLLALEYLHMLGIVYRDLKPENILVRKDGHIMLTDFDLSLRCSVNPTLIKSSSIVMEPPRVSGPCAGSNCIDPFCNGPSCKVACFRPRLFPSTARARKLKIDAEAQARSLPQLVAEPTEARSNSFVGTHEYLAPEIIKGEGHGSAVDWWTFGIFLYELLYGKTPFKGAVNDETLANVVLQNLKFPDTPIVSFQARDLIRGLLVKEPGNRLGTETGAAEIKRHSFFEGLNWALIRCAIPPQIPDMYDTRNSQIAASQGKEKRHMNYSADGEHLEFELF